MKKFKTLFEEAQGEVIGQHPSGIDVMITKARDKVTKKPTRNVVLVDTNSGKKTVILRSVKSDWDTGDIVDHIKSVHGNKFRGFSFNVNETIRKQGSKWVIYSKDGDKKLGTYDTKSAAQKRLGQKNSLEEAPAADYKRKVDDEEEVKNYKPRSDDEQKFVDMHKVEKKKHPVAPDEVHTGDRPKGKKGKTGEDHGGADEKGEPILKTYTQFAKMGGFGGDSYKGVGKSAGEKATVMQGSSKVSEEVELDEEAFKKGSLKLKSGETVKLDNSNAKALNSAMERLSGRNQLAMKAEVLKDKKSFEAMIKFAKSVT